MLASISLSMFSSLKSRKFLHVCVVLGFFCVISLLMKRIKLKLFYGPNVVSLQYTSSRHSKESVNGQGKCNPTPTNYTRSLDDPHILSGHVDTNLTGKFAYGFVLHNKKGLLSKVSDIERLTLVAILSIRRTGSSHDIILLHMGTYSSFF